jgi:Autographiviridae terminase large subunit
MSAKPSESRDYLARFANFASLVWDHLGLPPLTPVQIDMAEYLQFGGDRIVLEAFRGVGKSWLTSAFVLWVLLRNPQEKILVVSASKQRADDFTTFCMRLIREMDILMDLAPREGQRDSKISFDVGPSDAAHAASVKSVGITGQLAGSRADRIVADDVEVPNNSATQMMRDKLSESVKEFDAIIKPAEDAPWRQIIYLGTPQCEESLYNKLPDRGYKVRIWPARYPNKKQRDTYGSKLAPRIKQLVEADENIVGQPTDPKRFGDLDLVEREASYGRSGFALQFMLDTRLSDAERYPLKLADFIVLPLDRDRAPVKIAWGKSNDLVVSDVPVVGFSGDRFYRPAWIADDYAEYTGAVMVIDPSGRGRDECAYAVTKMLHGTLFLLASGGYIQGYTPETLEALCMTARDFKVNRVQIEANWGDGMFTALIKPVMQRVYPCTIEEVKHSVQKEKRIIDTLEPMLNQHRLVVSSEVIQKDYDSTKHMPQEDALRYQLFYQLTRITKEKGSLNHDDRLDALAMAVAYWIEQAAWNTDKSVAAHKEKLLKEELERFMIHAVGYKPKQKGWLNTGRVALGRPTTDAARKGDRRNFKT